MTAEPLPLLPSDWEPTRATLHAYAKGITAVPRALAPAHPKWWHASLRVRPSGLVTDVVPIPGGGALELRMDVVGGRALVMRDDGPTIVIPITQGATGTGFADEVIAAAAELGVVGDVDRSRFESDEPRLFDPGHARTFWRTAVDVATVLERHRRSLDGPVGPVQLWPHGFDMAFEWFGGRTEVHEEHGTRVESPAQINFGFFPGGDAYFYANPWPFHESFLEQSLPDGAEWHTDGWQGTKLPHRRVAARPDAATRLLAFFERVFEVASPALMS